MFSSRNPYFVQPTHVTWISRTRTTIARPFTDFSPIELSHLAVSSPFSHTWETTGTCIPVGAKDKVGITNSLPYVYYRCNENSWRSKQEIVDFPRRFRPIGLQIKRNCHFLLLCFRHLDFQRFRGRCSEEKKLCNPVLKFYEGKEDVETLKTANCVTLVNLKKNRQSFKNQSNKNT